MNVTLYLAEDIRLETGSKVSMIGFMPGNLVQIRMQVEQATGKFPEKGVMRIALLFSVTGARSGENKFSMYLTTPSAHDLPHSEGRFTCTGPGQRNNLVFHMPAFSVDQPGKYVAHLIVGDKDHQNAFWINATAP